MSAEDEPVLRKVINEYAENIRVLRKERNVLRAELEQGRTLLRVVSEEYQAELGRARAVVKAGEGVTRIAAERRRQIESEGWTREHDAHHDDGELAVAAAMYALPERVRVRISVAFVGAMWPAGWDFKPGERLRELEKAGALIAAEIDRLANEAAQDAPAQEATP